MRLLLRPHKNSPFAGSVYLIDTCSIIALQDVEVAGTNVLDFVRHKLRLTATSVLADEVQRRCDDGLLRRGVGGHWLRKYRSISKPDEERDDWEGIIPICCGTPPENDSKGEVTAAWKAIMLSTYSFENVIFVTDDLKSRNLFFNKLVDHFPLVRILDTLDFVRAIILCASTEKRLLLPQALSALRDAVSAKAKNTTRSNANGTTPEEILNRTIKDSQNHRTKIQTAFQVINSQAS